MADMAREFASQGLIGRLVGGIVSAFFGTYEGDDIELRRFQDGQRELNGRVELMEDISGRCTLTQLQNEVFANNWSTSWPRYFNWDSAGIGPSKHALWAQHYSPTRARWLDGILLEQPGTWEIDAQITSQGIFTVGGWASMVWEIAIIDLKTDALRSQKMGYNEIVQWHRTYSLNHTFIAEEGGRYLVVVAVRHSRNGAVTFPRGDNFTHLKVSRWDLRTDGPPSPRPEAPLPLD